MLVLQREGGAWHGTVKFSEEASEAPVAVKVIKIEGATVSFATDFNGADLRFTGKLEAGRISGAMSAIQQKVIVASGVWEATRKAGVAGFEGTWIGKFEAQAVLRQKADPDFDTRVAKPAYPAKGPKVLFDEAHNNIHTTTGLYKPFADLIRNDGYDVTPNREPFTPRSLSGYSVLIISNAMGPQGHRSEPAFTEPECSAVEEWVKGGGSLLFISDHAPMGAAAERLSLKFGVEMSKVYTDDPNSKSRGLGDITFSRENHLLGEHPILRGRNRDERVSKVVTFTGQSLKGPRASVCLLTLPNSAIDVDPVTKASVPAGGRSQGVAMRYGRGRVVVLGEAGMLSAQLDPDGTKFGMNYPATDNRQFGLNVIHWLSRLF
jgi:hypothetical protein